MSEVQHTPGPWTWEKNNDGLYGSGEDNAVLTYARYEGMWLHFGPHHDANARLIAVAPELLEERQAVANMLGHLEWSSPEHAEALLVELISLFSQSSALAKAEGR